MITRFLKDRRLVIYETFYDTNETVMTSNTTNVTMKLPSLSGLPTLGEQRDYATWAKQIRLAIWLWGFHAEFLDACKEGGTPLTSQQSAILMFAIAGTVKGSAQTVVDHIDDGDDDCGIQA